MATVRRVSVLATVAAALVASSLPGSTASARALLQEPEDFDQVRVLSFAPVPPLLGPPQEQTVSCAPAHTPRCRSGAR